MLIPHINMMNTSFGFWVWIGVGFATLHYLKDVKKPEKDFGLRIGLHSGAMSGIIVFVIVVLYNLIFVSKFGSVSISAIEQLTLFLPKVYDLFTLVKLLVAMLLLVFLPAVLTGIGIQLVYKFFPWSF